MVSTATIQEKILKHYIHIFVTVKYTLPIFRFKAANYESVRPGVLRPDQTKDWQVESSPTWP